MLEGRHSDLGPGGDWQEPAKQNPMARSPRDRRPEGLMQGRCGLGAAWPCWSLPRQPVTRREEARPDRSGRVARGRAPSLARGGTTLPARRRCSAWHGAAVPGQVRPGGRYSGRGKRDPGGEGIGEECRSPHSRREIHSPASLHHGRRSTGLDSQSQSLTRWPYANKPQSADQ
ncbi:NADH dehydrogenase [Platysternon megacephalum]|uniref:NADH dehydrogenase n=1 Tax=Platysternon megacephalum TaxID=55544 RepID=A0A4D9F8R9_9SAUR|nr:NADH dehydrogenase [Platysternon megacephalum]